MALTHPWSHLNIDFITDVPQLEGNTTILVVVDRFSCSIKLVALPALPTAMEVAKIIFHHIFRYYGIPDDIVSNQGPQFVSCLKRVWGAFMEKLGVSVSLTSGYHPQSNGRVERNDQDIGRYLCSYCKDNQNDWVEYAQNSLKHSAINLNAFQCVLGF